MTTKVFPFGILPHMSSLSIRRSQSSEPFFLEEAIPEPLRAQYERNLRLYDFLVDAVSRAIDDPRLYCRVSVILQMHKIAFDGLSRHAGYVRSSKVSISGSEHSVPDPSVLTALLEDMIEYLRSNWDRASGTHLASYALWRLLWIHPFLDGNGVVGRAFSYGIICLKAGSVLPGSPSLPEQITRDREVYYDALGYADKRWREGKLDVSRLEAFIDLAVQRQLASTS